MCFFFVFKHTFYASVLWDDRVAQCDLLAKIHPICQLDFLVLLPTWCLLKRVFQRGKMKSYCFPLWLRDQTPTESPGVSFLVDKNNSSPFLSSEQITTSDESCGMHAPHWSLKAVTGILNIFISSHVRNHTQEKAWIYTINKHNCGSIWHYFDTCWYFPNLIIYRHLGVIFSNESTLRMRWPKYWSFSFSIIPSKEIPTEELF